MEYRAEQGRGRAIIGSLDMQVRKRSFRTFVAGTMFALMMGFGVSQAIATDADDPGTRYESCSAWACRQECAPFGGSLGPGGPGKPLICYCCG